MIQLVQTWWLFYIKDIKMETNKEKTKDCMCGMKMLYTFSSIFANIAKGCFWLSVAFCLLVMGRAAMLFIMDLYGLY